ncbi:MAG: M20/M25/M40 family metallo-hydrolase, partial [Pseudomonadota bacterium]
MQDGLFEIVAQIDAEEPCSARVEPLGRSTPAKMDSEIQKALVDAAAEITPDRALVMPSGAGHDAQNMARHLPSAMMFVPSIGGISHHWTENTSDDDIKDGAAVFVDAIGKVLTQH